MQTSIRGVGSGNGKLRAWLPVAAIGLAVLLGIFTAVATQASLAQINDMADRRLAANVVRIHLLQFLSLLKDIESGQRGFVITGRDSFLAPYHTALAELPQAFAAMQADARGSAPPGFNWAGFSALVAQRQALAAQAIAERRSLGTGVLLDVGLFDEGKSTMDQVRAAMVQLDTHQVQRIAELSQQMQQVRRRANVREWQISALVGGLLALATGVWVIERRRRQLLFAALAHSHATLEQRVSDRTQALSQASEQIRGFAAELDRRIEAERRRLAREVHDQIGQTFTAIKMIFRTMAPGSLAPEQHTALAHALDAGVTTTRRIAAELRPPLLDELGLVAALEHYLKGVTASTGLGFEVRLTQAERLSSAQALQLFRIVQEACTNVLRHADARCIQVSGLGQGNQFQLVIEDDGSGFDPAQVRVGAMGLIGLQERAALLGGRAEVGPRDGGGTRVVIVLTLTLGDPT